MTSIQSLSPEILLRIFSYYLETETQKDFICNISHVCRYWRNICMDSSLWRTFDGTLPLYFVKQFCIKGYLKKTEKLKFCNCGRSLTRRQLQNIYKNLPCLKSINFSNIYWMLAKKECKLFIELIDHCPDLCKIILNEKRSSQPKFHYKLLETFLQMRGSNLISLNFSNATVSSLTELFIAVANSCPNLEELRARHIRGPGCFPIARMQIGLKKLKILRLGRCVLMYKEPTSEPTDGFPNLSVFTRPSGTSFSLSDLCFSDLLMKSPNLRVLNIRGCRLVTLNSLYNLPAKNVERLFVYNTSVYEHNRFIDIVKKWGHSLVELDVSEMKENEINSLFITLTKIGSLQNLKILYLNKTAVTMSTVQLIIQNCPKLNILDLESCQAIDKDHQSKYQGQTRIRELLDIDEGRTLLKNEGINTTLWSLFNSGTFH